MSYEYLNTRLRYMKKKMLGPEQFRSYLGMLELDELITALAETDYAAELEKSSVEFSGYEMIENALIQHVQRLFSKLYKMSFDDAKMLTRVLLERFEVFNLKTILRGFHVGSDPKETARSLFPTILYPTAFYQELLKREGIGSVIDYLLTVGNRYYKPLAEALPEYEAGKKLALLESALDSYYFGGSRKTLQAVGDENAKSVRKIIGMETDILNMVYALRLIESGVSSEEKYRYILQGGERLGDAEVRDLLSSPDKPTFTRKISDSYYGKKLGELAENITANDLQEKLENFLYQQNCTFDPGNSFDIHMTSSYIWRKNVEATNLRVIASGIWRHASQEDVISRLIWIDGMMPEMEAVKGAA
jgi:V/A-type H+-transporting ATPase subunit C